MVRKKMKHNGRFFLAIQTRFGMSYYRESGVSDVRTSHEKPFLYWTKCQEHAHGFDTVKGARAMARKLLEEQGIRTTIVNREGAVI